MDALKSAGRALIRSPSISRQSWGMARHQKLPENWTDTKESLQEGMVFHLKYLGVTVVDQPKGEGMAAAAIRRIITVAKASGKKFLKVTLTVSPRGIMLQDTITNELVENVSIYRISYCTADKTQDKVFAYIAQSQLNETLECHAFLCPKKKIAQAVTLTVAQAFRIAFDLWEVAQEEKCKKTHEHCNGPETAAFNGATGHVEKDVATANSHIVNQVQNPIISPTDVHLGITRQNSPSCGSPLHALSWEEDDGLDDAFSRLAESRTNIQYKNVSVDLQDPLVEDALFQSQT
ncbi:low density lipoprotein receptor adapter protein 1-like [Carcharodon carcharias]|uniref:low density lipoprotein receptor adapter protein 1-like n=1 Tax=Carcharodon carcharias TaxID=13397 RepID=UPI001B7D92CA|nr:low density lipoprotein receptor adapter protein 1-like [Carcharodon carcharias]